MDQRSRARGPSHPPAVAAYVVGVLLLASLFSYLDRHILSLLVPAIKLDLALTDTQISLLQGFSFAVFYSVMSLPMGWAADRYNRRNLIIFGITGWSLATVACGLAQNFGQLLAARMMVGIGEAALIPAAFSMIADYYRPEKRGRALGVFAIGLFGGAGLAFVVGGAILKQFGSAADVSLPWLGTVGIWQAAFVLVGLPGVLVALLLLTVREPVRTGRRQASAEPEAAGSDSFVSYVRAHKLSFIAIWGSYTLLSISSFGASAWASTMLVRKFGLAIADAGFTVGFSSMIGGVIGAVLGGWLGDRWTRQAKHGGKFRLTLVWWIGSMPALAGFALIPNVPLAGVCYGLYFFLNAIGYVSASAVIQDIVPPRLRGRASAVWLLLTGMFGQGLGPLAIALSTDYVFGRESALPQAILLVAIPTAVVGLLLSLVGLRHYDDRKREVDAELSTASRGG